MQKRHHARVHEVDLGAWKQRRAGGRGDGGGGVGGGGRGAEEGVGYCCALKPCPENGIL